MGAGASSLPTKLKEDDLHLIVKEMFNSFKDSDGYVDKELFIAAAFTGQEKEVIDLFMKFSKSGFMDAKGFHDFCVETKMLNRTNFTVTDSVRIFQKALVTVSTTTGNSTQAINYPTFRKIILPEISEKKSIHLDNLVFKLSRVECNVPRLIVFSRQNSCRSTKQAHASSPNKSVKREDEFDDIPVVEVTEDVDNKLSPRPTKYSLTSMSGSSLTGTPNQHSAATRIQSISRMKTASRYVMELKQVNILPLSPLIILRPFFSDRSIVFNL
jgi:hypothetical protein